MINIIVLCSSGHDCSFGLGNFSERVQQNVTNIASNFHQLSTPPATTIGYYFLARELHGKWHDWLSKRFNGRGRESEANVQNWVFDEQTPTLVHTCESKVVYACMYSFLSTILLNPAANDSCIWAFAGISSRPIDWHPDLALTQSCARLLVASKTPGHHPPFIFGRNSLKTSICVTFGIWSSTYLLCKQPLRKCKLGAGQRFSPFHAVERIQRNVQGITSALCLHTSRGSVITHPPRVRCWPTGRPIHK